MDLKCSQLRDVVHEFLRCIGRARPIAQIVDMVADTTAMLPEFRPVAAPSHIIECALFQLEISSGFRRYQEGALLWIIDCFLMGLGHNLAPPLIPKQPKNTYHKP